MADLTDNPLVLPAAGGLLALLLGFVAYRLRQRNKHTSADSSYLESRLQPDSFFGASGGQNVDTAESATTGSSMMYSPSQLDTSGDVDPVAEADVYLAYGRDLQAEEILKEALRINPSRVAIHSKMLEIYAKRRDIKAFEVLACEVYALVQGTGPEWENACTLGLEIDPENPMYQPGGRPAAMAGQDAASDGVPPGMANTQPFAPSNMGELEGQNPVSTVDLDLDFSLDLGESAPVADLQPSEDLTLDFDSSSLQQDPLPLHPEPILANDLDLAFDMPSPPSPDSTPVQQTTQAVPDPVQSTKLETPSDMMSFDMGDLSLDLGDADDNPPYDIPKGDPMETKLSLAAEFLAIGDMEGARSLAEEVVEQATGALKAKAASFLAELN